MIFGVLSVDNKTVAMLIGWAGGIESFSLRLLSKI